MKWSHYLQLLIWWRWLNRNVALDETELVREKHGSSYILASGSDFQWKKLPSLHQRSFSGRPALSSAYTEQGLASPTPKETSCPAICNKRVPAVFLFLLPHHPVSLELEVLGKKCLVISIPNTFWSPAADQSSAWQSTGTAMPKSSPQHPVMKKKTLLSSVPLPACFLVLTQSASNLTLAF